MAGRRISSPQIARLCGRCCTHRPRGLYACGSGAPRRRYWQNGQSGASGVLGTGDPVDDAIASSLENAARLAMADLGARNDRPQSLCRRCNRGERVLLPRRKRLPKVPRSSLGRSMARRPMPPPLRWRPRESMCCRSRTTRPLRAETCFILGTTFDNVADRLTNFAARQRQAQDCHRPRQFGHREYRRRCDQARDFGQRRVACR